MKRIHYAWWVCAGCALLIFCTAGLAVNAFTIYQPFILRGNGFTNAQSSLLITVRSLAAFFASILAEQVYRRLSPRTGMALGGILSALEEESKYGVILRAKGIVDASDGQWLYFDYVPGEVDLRRGGAAVTGRFCVIGSKINEQALKELFNIE